MAASGLRFARTGSEEWMRLVISEASACVQINKSWITTALRGYTPGAFALWLISDGGRQMSDQYDLIMANACGMQ